MEDVERLFRELTRWNNYFAILQSLAEKPKEISELSKEFGITEETCRIKLRELERHNLVSSRYGRKREVKPGKPAFVYESNVAAVAVGLDQKGAYVELNGTRNYLDFSKDK